MGKCNKISLRGFFLLSLSRTRQLTQKHRRHLRKERQNLQVYSPMVEINHPFKRRVSLIILPYRHRNTHTKRKKTSSLLLISKWLV